MIKLVVFDVDGTLVDHSNNEVYASSIEAIQNLKKKNIFIAIATGRTHYSVDERVLKISPDYIIGCNGQVIVDHTGNVLSCINFTQEETMGLYELSLKHRLPLLMKFEDATYMYEHSRGFQWIEDFDEAESTFKLKYDHNYDRHLKSLPQSISMVVEDPLKAEIEKQYPTLKFVKCGWSDYDIIHQNIDKSIGIEYIMNKHHINWDEVATFGDNMNDIEMLSKAKYGCAVYDASDVVKKAASYTTDQLKNDGIKKMIEKIMKEENQND